MFEGSVEVVGLADEVGLMAWHSGRDWLVGGDKLSRFEQTVLLAVDGSGDGATDFNGVEGGELGVQGLAHNRVSHLGGSQRDPTRVGAKAGQVGLGEVVQEIELTGLEREALGDRMEVETVGDGVKVGQARAEVGVVPHKAQCDATFPVLEAKRASATRNPCVAGAVESVGADGTRRGLGQDVQEGGVGLAQVHGNEIESLDHDVLEACVESLEGTWGRRMQHALDGSGDVVSGELAAVVETDAWAEPEAIGESLVGELPARGEGRDEGALEVVIHEAIEEEEKNGLGDGIGGQCGVEGAEVGSGCKGQCAARQRNRVVAMVWGERRGEAGAAGAKEEERRGCEHEGARKDFRGEDRVHHGAPPRGD
jgi:hypothetical protein